jgi:hypothetical protein
MADGTITTREPLRGRVSEAEWRMRVDLAALYRAVAGHHSCARQGAG